MRKMRFFVVCPIRADDGLAFLTAISDAGVYRHEKAYPNDGRIVSFECVAIKTETFELTCYSFFGNQSGKKLLSALNKFVAEGVHILGIIYPVSGEIVFTREEYEDTHLYREVADIFEPIGREISGEIKYYPNSSLLAQADFILGIERSGVHLPHIIAMMKNEDVEQMDTAEIRRLLLIEDSIKMIPYNPSDKESIKQVIVELLALSPAEEALQESIALIEKA